MYEIEILSIVSVQAHRIMFANHEIFENYYNPGYADGGGLLVLCMPAAEINYIRKSWLCSFK